MTFRDILRRHVLILGIALAACTISSSAHAQSSCVDRCGDTSEPACWCSEQVPWHRGEVTSCYEQGNCCQDYEQQCKKPTILSISPTSVPASGGAITIVGDEFGSDNFGALAPSVLVGGSSCLVTSWSPVLIECNAPAGQGSDVLVEVTNEWANQGSTAAGEGLNYIAAILVPALGYYGLPALACLLTLGAVKRLRLTSSG